VRLARGQIAVVAASRKRTLGQSDSGTRRHGDRVVRGAGRRFERLCNWRLRRNDCRPMRPAVVDPAQAHCRHGSRGRSGITLNEQ
jgi:hypothetical protein